MKISVGYQEAVLDWMIAVDRKILALSFFDRSQVLIRQMAALVNIESVDYDGYYYRLPRTKEIYGADRFIETFESGRDRVANALVVSKLLNKDFLITTEKDFEDDMFSLLMNKFTLPLLREWMPYLRNELKNIYGMHEYSFEEAVIVDDFDRELDFKGRRIKFRDLVVMEFIFNEKTLEFLISQGLKNGRIFITKNPVDKLNFNSLDQYYEKYGNSIVANLEEKIKPLAETSGFTEYTATRRKRLFPAQANIVNALVARLQKSNYAIVNSDMGTGKTLQALATMDAFFNKKEMDKGNSLKTVFEEGMVNYKAAVMCPGHLVDKWCSEAEEIYGMTGIAVTSLSQLIEINNNRDRYEKGKFLFVFGKDFAKLGEMLAPIPSIESQHTYLSLQYCKDCKDLQNRMVYRQFGDKRCSKCDGKRFEKWTIHEPVRAAICPSCGEALFKYVKDISPWKVRNPLLLSDFDTRKSSNLKCYHCGKPLWGTQVVNINSTPNYTWKRISFYTNKTHKTRKSAWVHKDRIKDFTEMNELEDGEYEIIKGCGTRRYSPAKYVLKHMKNFFDFFIADECHMYESKAAQGQAFASFVNVSKKTLALTGTLTNGYADGLYRLFWRLDPAKMIKNGYSFDSDSANEWNNKYGVLESREKVDSDNQYNASSKGGGTTGFRLKPGVSPQLMKDYLLESVVQLQISELSEGLPELNEEIICVDPPNEVVCSLNRVTETLKGFSQDYSTAATMSTALQYQLYYADHPYAVPPVKNPLEAGKIIIEPDDYSHLIADGRLLAKEEKIVEVVESELREGRNCYIFLENTGKDGDFYLLKRVKEIIEKVPGAKPLVMEASSTQASKRESWMRSKVEIEGYNVVISNPRLVETGIDFIWEDSLGNVYNFPTILYVNLSMRLDTLWQSSRRHYRLIQKEECRTYYFVWNNTMQLEILSLMAEKQVAVSAIQGGEFSARGLAAMAKGVDPKIELARRLKSGQRSDAGDIKSMLKAMTTSVRKKWSCHKNLLIEEVTEIIDNISKNNTRQNDAFVSLFNLDWDIDKSITDFFSEEGSKLDKKGKKNKKLKGQASFLDLLSK